MRTAAPGLALALSAAIVLLASLQACQHDPLPGAGPDVDAIASGPIRTPSLRLLTLNLAHGRGQAFHQLLTPDDAFQVAVERAGAFVARVGPDVVALQEADAPSEWSANFDHVATLARRSGLAHWFHGIHARSDLGGYGVAYGTALISRLPLIEPTSRVYDSSWRDTKGFVVATVRGPGALGEIDVVSVHHDFLSSARRADQARILIDGLRHRQRPLVLMGDLNAGWDEGVAEIATALGLEPCALTGPAATYPADEPRQQLDWILVSAELAVTHCEVLADPVSDHRALLALVYAGTGA